MKKKTAKKSYPERAQDVPVTQKMLYLVRDELKTDIRSVREDINSVRSEISSVKEDVNSVRSEISSVKEDVNSVRSEISSVKEDVNSVRSEISSVREDVNSVRADLKSLEHKMDARFSAQDSKFEKMMAEIHSVKILVEEQNAKNNIVLDGLTSLFHRQDRVEKIVSGNN